MYEAQGAEQTDEVRGLDVGITQSGKAIEKHPRNLEEDILFMPLEIKLAYGHIDKVRLLFEEYTSILGIDLGFQNYNDKFLHLPSDYALPGGRLYIAHYDNQLAGCIALRPFDSFCCEMKRLFVRPGFRGKRIGRALAEQIISDAKEMHYHAMVLDTLTSLTDSIALYKKLGFSQTLPYRYNPLPNALFLRLEL